jgi:hypothetical protein
VLTRILVGVGLLVALALGALWLLGTGAFVETPRAGSPQAAAISPAVVASRADAQESAAKAVGVARPKQVLFGDLHVHTTFSFDAFQLSMPMAGGDGAHPVSDACDFARHCAALDFWSINDHAITLGPRRWAETVDSIRECNAVASDPSNPDTVAFLGWEWTQVGITPETHWGHKNVVLRDLDDDAIPTRPISAGAPGGVELLENALPSPFLLGALAVAEANTGGPELAKYFTEIASFEYCPEDIPVRDLPESCVEIAPTPEKLFGKLDDWGHEALVIPHGTTWGFYTPPGSSWDKQLAPGQHDPRWQRLIEVMSGHGNSEEFRPFREVVLHDDGSRSCPEPNLGFLPSCWRAGEIIEARCLDAGEETATCNDRAEEARQLFVDADRNGGAWTVPGTTVADWQDAGQCRDCFQPSFNYRPRSSVQYILALARGAKENERFRFGMLSSSDNHSARPGTGYKEVSRKEFTEARFGNFVNTPLGERPERAPAPRSEPLTEDFGSAVFSIFETERGSSFFLNGGLAAVHSAGRSREEIWDAFQRREVYGTSGPRILLWFDLVNPPGGGPSSMGSDHTMTGTPIFRARAVGSFEQKPGCPEDASQALGPDQMARVCQGECYHPSDARRPITRMEIVRIRSQQSENDDIEELIQDPWKVLPCPVSAEGCELFFADEEYGRESHDTLYYVRAIEAPSQAVAADPLGCERNAEGRCISVSPCSDRAPDDDCLAETEERAWSSPIFLTRPMETAEAG